MIATVIGESNQQTFRKLVVIALLMFGFGFALVPFYEKICEVTGVRNLLSPDAVGNAETQIDLTRSVTIEFDANTRRLGWGFRPVESHRDVHPGEINQVIYEIRNSTDRTITAQAVPSYGPTYAAQFFKKIECFCFQRQALNPGEVKRMPLRFYVSPDVPKDIHVITLSYAFYNAVKK